MRRLLRLAALAVPALLALPAAGDDAVYANPCLGYRLRCPAGDWVLVRTPPFPLVDVVVYSTRDDASLAVSVDRAAGAGIAPEGVEAALQAWRGVIEVSHRDLDEVEGRCEPFCDRPAWRLSAAATLRLDGSRWRLSRTVVEDRGVVFLIDVRRPEAAAEATVRGLASALDSFESYEPAERDGDLVAPRGWFLSLRAPAGWTVESTPGEDRIEIRVDGRGAGRLRVRAWRRDPGPLEKAAAERTLAAELGDEAPAGPVAARNEKGLVVYTAPTPSGRAWVFAREARLYVVRAEGKGEDVYDSIEVHEDVSVDLDAERAAESDDLEGQLHYHEGRLERAAVSFARALEHFPRDATARNFLGLVALSGHRWDEAIREFRAARALFPVSRPIQVNLASALLLAGHAALAAREPDLRDARRAFEEALPIAERHREALAGDAAIAFNALGLAEMARHRFDRAAADLEHAVSLSDDPVFRNNLAAVHFNEAVELAARGSLARARTRLQKALEIRPDFPEARAALRQLEGR